MIEKKSLPERVLAMASAIQQIPAPTFSEQARADFVRQRFLDEGLVDVQVDSLGNVYGRVPGQGKHGVPESGRPVVVSAHLDTVFPEPTDLRLQRTPERICGAGIGDNSLGVAGLFGLLWMLRARPVESDIWLTANVGEEGLGNLRGMQAVVERFKGQPKAYIVLEGMALGAIYHRGLGVQRYRITARTAGGHAWVNFGQPSAIHELARLITCLETLPVSQDALSGKPRSSYNVGVIQGGSSVNTIAAEAWLELDLRSEDERHLAHLAQQVEALARRSCREGERTEDRAWAVEVCVELIGRRPSGGIAPDHPLVLAAQRALTQQGLAPRLDVGSTDANAPLSRGYPAVCIGLTKGGGAHSSSEYIETAPLAQGLAQLEACVREVDKIN